MAADWVNIAAPIAAETALGFDDADPTTELLAAAAAFT